MLLLVVAVRVLFVRPSVKHKTGRYSTRSTGGKTEEKWPQLLDSLPPLFQTRPSNMFFQRLCRLSRRKFSTVPNSLLLSFRSAPISALPRATLSNNHATTRCYSLFHHNLPTTSTTTTTPHYFSTFTSGDGDQDDQGNDGQDDTWDKGEQDEEWDDADFSDDEDDGIDVSQSIQAGEETLSYRVNDPNESLFIDPGGNRQSTTVCFETLC
jgi:hypothetical protein